MVLKLTTSFSSFVERNCSVSIVLDKRSNRKDIEEYPLSMRFTIDRKSFYYHIGGNYSEKDFSEICNVSKSKSPKYEEKKLWMDFIVKYKNTLKCLHRGQELTLDSVKMIVEGRSNVQKDMSFMDVWQNIIRRLQTENNGARVTTAEFYENALKSFNKIMWKTTINGFQITIEDLKKWNEGMMNGVMDANGEIVGKISDTTRGIYLRTVRAVWNECRKLGYLLNVEYPFSNVQQKGLIVIPSGATRKENYLDVRRMTRLYEVFINKEYSKSWSRHYTERANYSLGLFLTQYLCNGFNLMDAGRLKYSQYYFDTEKKAFKFKRKKTRARSEDGSEVIVPIIEPLQRILDEIAAKPVRDSYVFPHILEGATDEATIRKRIAQENSNIQDRVIKICEDVLQWDVRPSGTWCRHSFATNLTLAGVEKGYITESMGHSQNQSITDRYIANYPLEKQFEYNIKLLSQDNKVSEVDIKNMSKKQMQELLVKLINGN
jgi:hypothetical protein